MRKNRALGILASFGMLLPLAASGENLVKNGDAEAGTEGWDNPGLVICKAEPQEGEASFEISQKIGPVISKDFIPVNPASSHSLSCYLRNLATEPVDVIYVSLIPFDADKKQIESPNVNPYPQPEGGTETVLTAPCSPGDTTLKIKDGSKWKNYEYACVAFNVDDSGELGDLPNRNLSEGFGVKSVENKGGHWVVTLANKCGKSFPAGTKIREHAAAATCMYPIIAFGLKQADGWTYTEATINGMAKSGHPRELFWPKTAFVKVRLFATDPDEEPKKILVDNIKLVETK